MIDALNVIEGRDERRSFVRPQRAVADDDARRHRVPAARGRRGGAFPLVMSTFGLKTFTGDGHLADPLAAAARADGRRAGGVLPLRAVPRRRAAALVLARRGVAALLWLAGSAALSFYLSNFADYNATYGSLGAAIGLMMWMWLSTIAVLLGAQLDTVIDRKLPEWRS